MNGKSSQIRTTQTLAILSLLCLTAAAVAVLLTPLPDGPWVGMYQAYAPTWVLLLLSGVCITWAVTRGVTWRTLVLFGLGFVVIVVGLSLQWGYVYGQHDPWTHQYYVTFEVLDFSENPYPGFHAGVIAVAQILGISKITVLRYTTLIASLTGAVGLAILLRRLSAPRRACQYAFIAGTPAVFMGFITRPFTMAWPFAAFVAWGIFSSLERKQTLSVIALFGVLLTIIHPQLPFFASTFFVAGIVSVVVRPYIPTSYRGMEFSLDLRSLSGLLAGFALVTGVYLTFVTGNVQGLLETLGDRLGEQSQSTPTPSDGNSAPTPEGTETSGKDSLLAKLFSQPGAISEVFARLTYILLLSGAVGLSAIEKLRERDWTADVFFFVTVIIQFGIFFLFVDLVLSSEVVNVRRGLKMAPLVLLPGAAYVLRTRSSARGIGALMTLILLSGGLIVAYPSDHIGAVPQTATSEEVAGVEWLGEHNPQDGTVIGGTMTFWEARGLHGKERISKWASTDEYAPTRIAARRDGYPWQVRDPLGLVVVDSVSIALARQEAQEAGAETAALRDLETMPIRHSSVYENGGTTIYKSETTRTE